jgi:hypothetical protein
VDDNANLTFLCLVHQFPEPDMQLAPSEGVRDDIAQHKKDETGKSYMVWWKRREVGRGLSSMLCRLRTSFQQWFLPSWEQEEPQQHLLCSEFP